MAEPSQDPILSRRSTMVEEFRTMVLTRRGTEDLQDHLEEQYGISIVKVTELEIGVFKIDQDGGTNWVVRVFPSIRSIEDVKSEAQIMQLLLQHQFPVERCASPDPVSSLHDQPVLVTEFIEGTKPRGGVKAFYRLGDLLGRLHTFSALTVADTRAGGAWHHVSATGGPREEIDAAKSLLASTEVNIPQPQHCLFEKLSKALEEADDLHDLPQALVHPDFVLANAIVPPGGGFIMIDWAGTGKGPRISSLGFALWAAGCWDLGRLDAVVAGYRKHVSLEPEELNRLDGAISLRPLILSTWEFCTERKKLSDVAGGLREIRGLAEKIASRVRSTYEEGNGTKVDAKILRE